MNLTGTKWLCTDEDYPHYNQTCTVIDGEDIPGHNGDDDIEVRYENGDTSFMKVRRFYSRHKLLSNPREG